MKLEGVDFQANVDLRSPASKTNGLTFKYTILSKPPKWYIVYLLPTSTYPIVYRTLGFRAAQ